MKRLVNEGEAIRTVMRLLKVGGTSGREQAVARHIRKELLAAGVPPKGVAIDNANRRFPLAAQCGNLIATVPGRGSLVRGKPLLFSAHMDTVGLAADAEPVRKGLTVVPKEETALGADDRSGVGVLVTLAKTLRRLREDHPPLVLLFTACEEAGLWGARYVDPRLVRRCAYGFNFDGGAPAELCIAAPSQDKITVQIDGIPSHAGVAPEKGASAAVVFAKATANLSSKGWLGKVKKGRSVGTSNIGVVCGGVATNIVTPHVKADGEARSYSNDFLRRIIDAFRKEFTVAAAKTKNAAGKSARVRFDVSRLYKTFDLGERSPVVREAAQAARAAGLGPVLKRQFGGLDANWLNAHGLPTVTLGAGGHNVHATSEKLNLKEYLLACEVAVRLAL